MTYHAQRSGRTAALAIGLTMRVNTSKMNQLFVYYNFHRRLNGAQAQCTVCVRLSVSPCARLCARARALHMWNFRFSFHSIICARAFIMSGHSLFGSLLCIFLASKSQRRYPRVLCVCVLHIYHLISMGVIFTFPFSRARLSSRVQLSRNTKCCPANWNNIHHCSAAMRRNSIVWIVHMRTLPHTWMCGIWSLRGLIHRPDVCPANTHLLETIYYTHLLSLP